MITPSRTHAALAGTALMAAALWLCLVAAPASAQVAGHPFPPAAGQNALMRSPGLLSGAQRPLGLLPHTGYGAWLARPVGSPTQPLALGLLRFYRTVVSPVNGSNSDLAPVPSLFAVQAMKSHGILLGTVLTAGRLIDEPSVVPWALRFTEDGRIFFYDPLRWNVYWLPGWLRNP